MNTKQIQLKHVLDHLESGETLTAVKADCIYSIKSLSSRISELRASGHKIESIKIGGGNVRYELDDNVPFEREFFAFLKEHDVLDNYIYLNTNSNGVFTIMGDPVTYVAGAFLFTSIGWRNIHALWGIKLKELKSNPTQSN